MLTLRAVALALLALLVAPLAADAQQPTKPARVGILAGAAPTFDPTRPDAGAFVAGLRDHGYVVGQNVVLEFRSALGWFDRFQVLAAELVSLKVDVIATATASWRHRTRAAPSRS